jgi:hypothetical protein
MGEDFDVLFLFVFIFLTGPLNLPDPLAGLILHELSVQISIYYGRVPFN